MTDRTKSAFPPKAERRAPSQDEVTHMAAARAWLTQAQADRPVAPRVKITKAGSVCQAGPEHSDYAGFAAQLCQTLATTSLAFCDKVLGQLAGRPSDAEEETMTAVSAGLDFIAASQPKSELETMLLVQAWTTHQVAMTQQKSMAAATDVEALAAHGTLATKLGKLFIQQTEALAKLRGGNTQKVEVRYVYVNGPAFFGDPNEAGTGGGVRGEKQPQPHAITHGAPDLVPAVWRQNPQGDAVPVAGCSREEAMQDARGE